MPVRVYKSTDTGAPTLTGQVGSLVNVLRACLVDGYGSQSPAGWSMPYTDGQTPPRRAHFRQAPRTGWDQYDIEIKDDGATSVSSNDARYAEAWGWHQATGLAAGTLSFPLRSGSGLITLKSATANATNRSWLVVATDRAFYIVLYHQNWPDSLAADVWFYGDTLPVGSTDVWAVALHGGDSGVSSPGIARFDDRIRHFPYTFQGAPGPVPFGRVWPSGVATGDNAVGNGSFTYPNGPDGRGYIDRVLISESGHIRAILPGFWVPLHNWKSNATITNWMEFSGSGQLAGRSFIVCKWGTGGTGIATAVFCLETSDTWYVV